MGCKHPWHTMYVDNDNGLFRLKPCCRATDVVGTADSIEEIYDHPALKKIRKQFTKGRKVPSVCVGCVDRRKESLTTPIFKGLPYYDSEPDGIVDWDIRTDHICNLKCAMCGPYQSSKWHEDLDIYTKFFKDATNPRKAPDWDYILEHTKNKARRIYLAGGEPFYSKQVLMFLEELSNFSWNCKYTQIDIQTNGVSLNDKTFKLLQRFKNVNFCMSVDAITDVNHIIRFPTNWDIFLENYDMFKRINNNKMLFSVTIQAMNLPVIDDLVEFFPNDSFVLNKLHYPLILHINSLKPEVIADVRAKTKLPKVKQICKEYKYDAENNVKLQKYLQDLDTKRKTLSPKHIPWCFA